MRHAFSPAGASRVRGHFLGLKTRRHTARRRRRLAGSTKIQIEKDTVQFTYYSFANVADPDGSLPLSAPLLPQRNTARSGPDAMRNGTLLPTLPSAPALRPRTSSSPMGQIEAKYLAFGLLGDFSLVTSDY